MQAAICLTPAVPDLPSVSNQGRLVSARSVKQLTKDSWSQGTVWMNVLAAYILPHNLDFVSLMGGMPFSWQHRAVFWEKQTFSWSSATASSYWMTINSAFPIFLLKTKRLLYFLKILFTLEPKLKSAWVGGGKEEREKETSSRFPAEQGANLGQDPEMMGRLDGSVG